MADCIVDSAKASTSNTSPDSVMVRVLDCTSVVTMDGTSDEWLLDIDESAV